MVFTSWAIQVIHDRIWDIYTTPLTHGTRKSKYSNPKLFEIVICGYLKLPKHSSSVPFLYALLKSKSCIDKSHNGWTLYIHHMGVEIAVVLFKTLKKIPLELLRNPMQIEAKLSASACSPTIWWMMKWVLLKTINKTNFPSTCDQFITNTQPQICY